MSEIDVNFVLEKIVEYRVELIFVQLVLISLISYQAGKKMNKIIISKFRDTIVPMISEQFSYVGLEKENPKGLFLEESIHCYKFYSSGRVNLNSMLLTFDLKKRQDIFSYWLTNLVWQERDLLTVDIGLDVDYLPVCFLISKKHLIKSLRENHLDVKHLTEKQSILNLHETYTVLGEHSETMNSIFDQKTV